MFMVIEVRCPRCGNLWKYKGHAVMATCTSCYRKVKVRSLPDPNPAPKAPAGVRKMLAKKEQPLADGQTIQDQTQEQATGRTVQVQTIVTTAPKKGHTVRPLVAREVVGNCRYCGKPLRERPLLNVMLDEHDRYHSTCILSKIIMESEGDLQASAQQYGVPLSELQNRVLRLKALGWKLPDGVSN